MIRTMLLLSFAGLAAPLRAQSIEDCDWRAEARNIAEPWEANSRTFANGAVRIALLDTIEPAAVPFFLLVISPPGDEIGSPQCKIIGSGEGLGFSGIEFVALDAAYDPARGLLFEVPAQVQVPDQDVGSAGRLAFTLNQSTGEISAEFAAEPE